MTDFWYDLEMLPLAMRIGESWWFPLLESIHVLTAMFVVGSIIFVDLRLLGLTATRYASDTFAREIVRWTWAAFALAVVSGLGMFITRASAYIANRAFQVKLVLLVLAALNMVWFQYLGSRNRVADGATRMAASARFAGAVSLLCWIGVTLAGRWTGHLS